MGFNLTFLRKNLALFFTLGGSIFFAACPQPDSTSSSSKTASATSTTSTTNSVVPTPIPSSSSSSMAFQVITKADSAGSFDNISIPVSGGIVSKIQRIFNLDGSQIPTIDVPAWFAEGGAFLTSTRTTAGAPAYTNQDTACAYMDSYTADNNEESSGYYTIDGLNTEIHSSDIDQCVGTTLAERNKLGVYIKLDRRFMNSTDKLQVIVKMRPIDAPNAAPNPTSCVVGGYFDAGNCSNAYYTITMRTNPYAAAKPFFILFPSAKALDLLSESVLLPLTIDSGISTISIDRVKGGAIFYGVSVIRVL